MGGYVSFLVMNTFMTQNRRVVGLMACLAVMIGEGRLLGAALPEVAITTHQKPCNLFAEGDPVRLNVALRRFTGGTGTLVASVSNYFGECTSVTTSVTTVSGKQGEAQIDFGRLAPGYYDVRVLASIEGSDKKKVCAGSDTESLGVVRFMNRTSAQAMKDGSRFGLKTFQIGSEGVWWNRRITWQLAEAVDACEALGLQWTRHLFNQSPGSNTPGAISTLELITNHQMNVVMKIEGFPESCFDAKRYGSLEDWKKKKQQWSRKTVPLKEPYQKWLQEELAKIPAGRNVFEIANEPWDQMSPEEFAELCQMIVPVVKAVQPDALIGPNSAMGPFDWEKRVIKAGGYKGMTMLATHPYSFTPMPEVRIRGWIRNYHDFIRRHLGYDLPLYVTEYGWSSAPKNPQYGKTERQQAQYTVRESLMLYAEDCKALIPHWMADREQDPKDREHWFGFFRLKGQPKPVLVAHAVSARMIDCSRFAGDLACGPGVGAMLFERGGVFTLAVWTLDEQRGGGRAVDLTVGAGEVTVVDIMGREKKVKSAAGKITVKASADMTYLVGVSPELEKLAVRPGQEPVVDCWNPRVATITAPRAQSAPVIDGNLDEWAAASRPVALAVSGGASGTVSLAWSDSHVFAAIRVTDSSLVNAFDPSALPGVGAKGKPVKQPSIEAGDAVTLNLCPRPSRQPSIQGCGQLYDYAVSIAPVSASGKPAFRMSNIDWDQPVVNPGPDDKSGIQWAVVVTNGGWTAEAAIPVALLQGLPGGRGGSLLSCQLSLSDLTATGGKPRRCAVPPVDKPMQWTLTTMEP